jgi:hypothetical protein
LKISSFKNSINNLTIYCKIDSQQHLSLSKILWMKIVWVAEVVFGIDLYKLNMKLKKIFSYKKAMIVRPGLVVRKSGIYSKN